MKILLPAMLFLLFHIESSAIYLKKRTRSKSLSDTKHSFAIFKAALQKRRLKRSLDIISKSKVDDHFNDVLVELIHDLNEENDKRCHLILYYNREAVSIEQLQAFRNAIKIPIILIDIASLRFPLLTLKRMKTKSPLLQLLEHRDNPSQCRLLLAWSTMEYQRGLLLIARAEPNVIGPEDIAIFPTYDKSLNRFVPQIRSRIIVRRMSGTGQGARGRRALAPEKYLIERVCEWCKNYNLVKVGEFKSPGGWTKGSGSSIKYELYGTKLSITYTNSVPNVFPIMGKDTPRLEGLEIRMLDYASRALNFSYRLYEPKDKEWGRRINGSWTGKVGEILKGEADLAIGGIVYTPERAAVLSYASLFHQELWGIVCPTAAQLPLWPYVLFPFYGTASSMMYSFVIILHLFAFLIATVVDTQKLVVDSGYISQSLSDSIFHVCKVGVALYIRFLIFLYFYSLYSWIMFPKHEDPITSVDDLLISGKPWGIVKGTTVQRVFTSSNQKSLNELASSATYLDSISEGFQMLELGNLCLVGIPKRFAKASINTKYTTKCGEPALQVSDEELHTVMGGWITQYGSILNKKIHTIVLQMEMFGLLDKWRNDLFEMLSVKSEKLPCLKKPVGPLTLSHLRLVFAMLLIGYLISISVFIGEYVSLQYFSKKKERSNLVEDFKESQPKDINQMMRFDTFRGFTLPNSHTAMLRKKEALLRNRLGGVLREVYGIQPPS